ncbi:MAG: hypothetical protein DVB25_08405 [Verrucomicrobia bacterium]|nr:MAG: hypothetical protein DVB25_08405 [Verrucomicrobiota bacterium]
MPTHHLRQTPGHILATAALIGSLALVLAIGLAVLGLTDKVDAAIAACLSRVVHADNSAGFANALPAWALWLATALLAYAMAFATLGVAASWRRLVLWFTTLGLVVAWAPVLGLAALTPQIAAPLVATLWSGACALVYTRSHRMPCDEDLS